MKSRYNVLSIVIMTIAMTYGASASANARGVGLGVAGGLAYSPTTLDNVQPEAIGTSVSWGFFVDIPLRKSFYISPAAMIYELDLGSGPKPVTDIDINFKFIVPVGPVSIGAGVITGLTVAEERYAGHWGLLGYASHNLVSNLDVFLLAQYKRLVRSKGEAIDDIHGYAGAMFRF